MRILFEIESIRYTIHHTNSSIPNFHHLQIDRPPRKIAARKDQHIQSSYSLAYHPYREARVQPREQRSLHPMTTSTTATNHPVSSLMHFTSAKKRRKKTSPKNHAS